ncbi:P-loop containing nucleoside triphosphate hydrolase protein [Geopyxis carbonaria]|nr:P-loop containing nucleoside triphosphate hydrolase protein [Geopyxis carbonaria]
MARRAAPGMEAPDGWLWLETPDIKYPNGTIEFYLHELCDHHVLRCTYKMITGNSARVRIYLLPEDVGRGLVSRVNINIRRHTRKLMEIIDTSRAHWEGTKTVKVSRKPLFELDQERSSLFYLFNTMESPKPDPDSHWIKEENVKDLLRTVLNSDIVGIRTTLYEYQKRSAAMMLQRELSPIRTIDSRLRSIFAPSGEVYYIDMESMEIYQEPCYFDDVRGGILAEEMGTGKTLICLAVILSTKNQYAHVPEEYCLITPSRAEVPSLMDSCVSIIWRNSIPWRNYDDVLSENCLRALRQNHGYYEIPPIVRTRSNRYFASQAKERIFLGSGTIIVCPPNLVDQWRSEILKHVQQDCLKFIILAQSNSKMPSVTELLQYDLVVFSRTRFDLEEREGKDLAGRKEAGGRPLKQEAVYKSPLMSIRWKRLIVDEGHSMGSSGGKSHGISVAARLPVECRWIVSGTPSSGLLGVTAGMTAVEGESEEDIDQRKKKLLNDRKEFQLRETDDINRLGRIVRDFLQLRPWAPSNERGEQASWSAYVTKGFSERRMSSTTCIQNILSSLMIRHTQEDITKSITLPPLYHKLVYLEPHYFEKLSMNLFLGVLAVNAVTSERQDQDYMFHPKSRSSLRLLVNNLLKESGFFWTGFSRFDVENAVKNARDHLHNNYTNEDIHLLHKSISTGNQALESKEWNYFAQYHDMGFFVSKLPSACTKSWSLLEPSGGLTMLGATQILEMQKYVASHAYEPNVSLGLAKAGNQALLSYKKSILQQNSKPSRKRGKNIEETDKREATPRVKRLKSAMKRDAVATVQLPDSEDPVMGAKILGTTSTKLSYLISSILKHVKSEKTLIFYESEQVAWYIAQALEVIGIEYLAFQKNLSGQKKAQYIVAFHELPKFRVLLMDLTQAAHGLNVCSASRVYFVNAVWTPSIEAQALKRAHRIGQVRPVYVETLVMKGTLEEEMIKRRDVMSDSELKETHNSIVNDSKMRDIIANLNFWNIDPEDNQVAKLENEQNLFGVEKMGGINHNNSAVLDLFKPSDNHSVNTDFEESSRRHPTMNIGEGQPLGPRPKRKIGFTDAGIPTPKKKVVKLD